MSEKDSPFLITFEAVLGPQPDIMGVMFEDIRSRFDSGKRLP